MAKCIDRMPLHADFFLPARRTDLIAVRDLDLDAMHRHLWRESDSRDQHSVKRPTVNNYVVAMLIAQGRCRRHKKGFFVKDPDEWEDEVVDYRDFPSLDGWWRCQFCGQDYETPANVRILVACWDCSELIGLRSYFMENLWDEWRFLKTPVRA